MRGLRRLLAVPGDVVHDRLPRSFGEAVALIAQFVDNFRVEVLGKPDYIHPSVIMNPFQFCR